MIMILLSILIGLFPGLFWLWIYNAKDKKRPEKPRYLAQAFLLGMVVTIPVAIIEMGADRYMHFSSTTDFSIMLIGTLLIVAPVEEYAKFAVVKRFFYNKGKFDEAFDGIIYGVMASLGFASSENILAMISKGLDALLLRAITATLLHALAASIMGYFLGLAFYNKKYEKQLIAKGLISAIILHGMYNFILVTETKFTFLLIALVLVLMYVMGQQAIAEIKKQDDRMIPAK